MFLRSLFQDEVSLSSHQMAPQYYQGFQFKETRRNHQDCDESCPPGKLKARTRSSIVSDLPQFGGYESRVDVKSRGDGKGEESPSAVNRFFQSRSFTRSGERSSGRVVPKPTVSRLKLNELKCNRFLSNPPGSSRVRPNSLAHS